MPSVLASAVALTGTQTASTNTAQIGGAGYHTLFVQWTPGTAANVLTVNIEARLRDGTWTPADITWSTAASRVKTNHSLTHTAADTTEVPIYYNFEIQAHEIRIKYDESDAGSSTRGTISAQISSRSS